ncbi:MAG: sigma-E factor negative regulatory protein [Rhizobacter sp.]|nr:sigma-E factor negative regulatory protein [Rhizobacter sp.]
MSQGSENKLPAPDDLSALMDGELEASALGRACGQWRESPEARAQWHAYHLIGDVLRSEDLSADAAHDAAFLASFRQRLAQEPVVLAPTPLVAVPAQAAAAAPRRSWAAPAAVAAGFVAVAGVLLVSQMSGGLSLRGSPADATLAAASAVQPAIVVSATEPGDPPAVVLNGQLIRDARLDEYLSAHKKFGGSSVPGGPSGFLRNAAADGTSR